MDAVLYAGLPDISSIALNCVGGHWELGLDGGN
jgi:hypothetical protein